MSIEGNVGPFNSTLIFNQTTEETPYWQWQPATPYLHTVKTWQYMTRAPAELIMMGRGIRLDATFLTVMKVRWCPFSLMSKNFIMKSL